ncbi:MAG TPA: AIR synthase-related protein, partial [Blastocatellia bacterium]|nr:AIR synthase-related protein [Blastocatellia bacterium]
LGECAKGRAVTRSGAHAGDTIYVTGTLGASALGLKLLEQGFRLTGEEDQARRQALLKHLAPEPRLQAGRAIGEAGLATAMIDISDGLSTDLWHILEESGCGAIIRAAAMPIADCVTALAAGDPQIDVMHFALHGGEEYELLFTAPPETQGRVADLANALGLAIAEIGRVIAEKELYLERDGRASVVRPSGYEHRMDSD